MDFGHALGRLDDCALLPDILDAQRQSGSSVVDFLAGYLRAVFEMDANKWDLVMDGLSRDHDLRRPCPRDSLNVRYNGQYGHPHT